MYMYIYIYMYMAPPQKLIEGICKAIEGRPGEGSIYIHISIYTCMRML